MVICLERGPDLHIAQLMPLPLIPVKSRLVLPFWYQLTRVYGVSVDHTVIQTCVVLCDGCLTVVVVV